MKVKVIPILMASLVGVSHAGMVEELFRATPTSGSTYINADYKDGTKWTSTHAFTDEATGIEFEAELIMTAYGGTLTSIGGTRSAGINGPSDANGALDVSGEGLQWEVGTITITGGPTNGTNPEVVFDGFTGVALVYTSDETDAGQITTAFGTSTNEALWHFNGALGVKGGAKLSGSSNDDSLYTWDSALENAHADVDISQWMPSTFYVEWVTNSVAGDNRWRGDDIRGQFTVTGLFIDTDGDGLLDAQELVIGTSTNNPDTDGDTFDDAFEYYNGMNPTNNIGEAALSDYVVANRGALGLATEAELGLASDDDILVPVDGGKVNLSLQMESRDNLKFGSWTNEGSVVDWTYTVDDGRSYYNVRPAK